MDQTQIFFIGWLAAAAYVGTMFGLAWRLGRLRAVRADPAIPTTDHFIRTWGGWWAVRFLFSGRHRQVGDPLVTGLVIAGRALFVVTGTTLLHLFLSGWGWRRA